MRSGKREIVTADDDKEDYSDLMMTANSVTYNNNDSRVSYYLTLRIIM